MSFESDKSIGFLIAKARNVLKNEFEKELKPYSLSYAHRIILIRLCEKDGLTQKDLAEDTYFEQSNLTLMLNKLELKGLVERVQKESDRRAYLVTITPKGRKLRNALVQMGENVMERALHGVNDTQKTELAKLLQSVHENLKSTKQ
ncbi:MAG: MarR family transcriptional regulator [Sulfuricurvum sp.]|uniref:MarR family winged helix-turn-helix transcriptional regulator n=1 Tax=Sulfuricurvum sp. TaxID=2025608 RepID=UPI002603BBE3|nr:MarR family transcriptional regulator [Sulfuricurvum sp.]MDD2369479.1 MarR family transcriptional regulator [Sulfuricurvum sp.]MDD2950304.1 MarR family transcriptional regulator [Sulfuricurvum sp.]MDD5117546.1 MarR family transcriptional regulator [Sulfuricurvum sp.]